MVTATVEALAKSLESPDLRRDFPNGQMAIVNLGHTVLARIHLEPGWRWSRDVRPTVKTESCQIAHVQYVLSGNLMVQMDDGTQLELKPGDAASIPPGHDAWVVGDEPFVAIDFGGMKEYLER